MTTKVGTINVNGTFTFSNINATAITKTDVIMEFNPAAGVTFESPTTHSLPTSTLGINVFDLSGSTLIGRASIGGLSNYASGYLPIRNTLGPGFTFSGFNGTAEAAIARFDFGGSTLATLATSALKPLGLTGVFIDSLVVSTTSVSVPGAIKFNNTLNKLQYCTNTNVFADVSIDAPTAGSGISIVGTAISVTPTLNITTLGATTVNAGSVNLTAGSITNTAGITSVTGTNGVSINGQITTATGLVTVATGNNLLASNGTFGIYNALGSPQLTSTGPLQIAVDTLSSANFTSTGLKVGNISELVASANITFADNIVMASGKTVDGVDISVFNTDYLSKVNQDVRNTASPAFVAVGVTGAISSATANITTSLATPDVYTTNLRKTIAGTLTLKDNMACDALVTIDGVDLSVFNADYVGKVNQDVRTTASPSFVAVSTSGALSGASAVVTDVYTTNLRKTVAGTLTIKDNMACDALVTIDGVDLSVFNADYVSKVNQDVRTTAGPTFVSVNGATQLDLKIATASKVTITSTLMDIVDKVSISPGLNATDSFIIKNSAGNSAVSVDNTNGSISTLGPTSAVAAFRYRSLDSLAASNTGLNATTGIRLGTAATTKNSYDMQFNYTDVGSNLNALEFVATGATLPHLKLYAGGGIEQGFSTDVLAFSQVYRYATTDSTYYRSANFRLNSGVSPGGINRMEFFGVNGRYEADALTQSGWKKSFGFSFQQRDINISGSYQSLLDLDTAGVVFNPIIPMYIPMIRSNASDIFYIHKNTLTATETFDLVISNCLTSNVGIEISPVGTSDATYIKSVTGTGSVVLQKWVGIVPTDAITISPTGVKLDYSYVGTNGPVVTGGLRMNGANLEFYNGTAWKVITAV
jgi:hypothetical protein